MTYKARKRLTRKILRPSRGIQSRQDLAIELLRLEHERTRLTQSIAYAAGRLENDKSELNTVDNRIGQIYQQFAR